MDKSTDTTRTPQDIANDILRLSGGQGRAAQPDMEPAMRIAEDICLIRDNLAEMQKLLKERRDDNAG